MFSETTALREVLINTLEIIGKTSNSSAGYILKLNSREMKVLASFGECILNLEDLQPVQKGEGKKLTAAWLSKTFSSEEFLSKHSWKSAFIRSIPVPSGKVKGCFLVLFSGDKENFSKEITAAFSPLVKNLGEQLIGFDSMNAALSVKTQIEDGKGKDILVSKSRELLESFFEASEDLIFVLDKDGCIIKINEYGAACLDYVQSELLGRHLIELVASREKHSFAKSFRNIIEEEKLASFESVLISRFGNEIIFQMNCKPVYEGGSIQGAAGIGKNITALRNYEEKISDLNLKLIEANRIISLERQRSNRHKAILAELNKMKSEFISNISHELRTPLASIIGFSETISSDPDMPQEMKQEFNEIILNEGKRLARLINDVLDLSKLEAGQIEIVKTAFNAIELLNEAIESNRKNIEAKNIHLTAEFPAEPVELNADREKIFRAISSLINNAVKFNHQRGRITITAQNLYKEFEVTISDTGIGIPERDLPYMFQKFYRVSRPGGEIPGTGLSLVFVKQIVDLHKGFLSIHSELNKGTTVLLKLPKEIKV